MKRIWLLTVVIIGIMFLGCDSNKSGKVDVRDGYIIDYDQKVVDRIIKDNDSTVIFVWTEWCVAGKSTFVDYGLTFIAKKPDNIGFVSIYLGDEEGISELMKTLKCEYVTYRTSSYGGIDKLKIYRILNSLVSDFNFTNSVPICILCDRDGNVLNVVGDIYLSLPEITCEIIEKGGDN